ncbi:YggS family pyridoxal phosphate-dependent enzyme [Corynebacterium sp. A21]|uniref:YggS family pyridoxal phosphate-dependent enzyme n=1 Tax=Corynebacterium sp. A21 TaxID=3457318 RepID=UPI003FD6A1C0
MNTEKGARRIELAGNIARVQERIDAALIKAGREGEKVQLLPVSKFHPAEDLRHLVELGYPVVAENREQEARVKAAAVPEAQVHMIGQIQSKKANSVARWAAAVHSIDSEKLILGLERGMALALERGERSSPVLPCFIQLSADGDTSRGGAVAADVDKLAAVLRESEHLELAGVMCVPPLGADPAAVFAWAAGIRDGLGEGLRLSAGMSGDLETAICGGSDIVRVGTAIFGNRPLR